jgi:hypothetical protein
MLRSIDHAASSFPMCCQHWPRRLSAVAATTAVLLAVAPARADIMLWESEGIQEGEPLAHLEFRAFAQPGFIWRDNDDNSPITDDTFLVRRARLGFEAKLLPMMYLDMSMDLTPTAQLLSGHIDGRFHQAFGIALGQQKIPFLQAYRFGSEHLAFNDRAIYTSDIDRPFLRYLNEYDIGIKFHGRVGNVDPDSMFPVFDYALGAFVGRGPNQTRNDHNSFLYAARVQLHALGLPGGNDDESDLARNRIPRVGVGAGVYSNCDDRGQWNRGFTTDAEFRFLGIYASATFLWFKNGRSSGLGSALGYGSGNDDGTFDGPCPGVQGAPDHIASGASAQLQYVLPRQWLGNQHALELLTRFDTVSPIAPCNIDTGNCGALGGDESTPGYIPPADYNDADNAPSRRRFTFGINWFPSSEQLMRISVNYQLKRELELVQTAEGTIQGIKDDVLWIQVQGGI